MFTDRPKSPRATDWDSYYASVPASASLTRKYTASVLLDLIKRYSDTKRGMSIVEVGGANSCFLDSLLAHLHPGSYTVIDTNRYGLSLLANRFRDNRTIRLHEASVLSLPPSLCEADVVFSVGLVEHFNEEATRLAVQSHFSLLRPGGLAILTFPTPTMIYRAARATLELSGLWKFHDERPLDPNEVRAAVEARGDILEERTLWPLILTQHVIVARKNAWNAPGTEYNS